MKQFINKVLIGLVLAIAGMAGAVADVAVTAGSGTTIFAFTCFTSKVCAASVTVNSAGTEVGTLANPIHTTVDNATDPGQALMSASSPVALASNQSVADACMFQAKTNLAISFQTTSITQLIALSGSTKIYVCSLSLIASAATVFSITGGTGSNCGTPAALIGTTSATHGLSLAANGGLTLGNGGGTVAVTAAGSELCIVQSGAGDLVGNLTYVQQ